MASVSNKLKASRSYSTSSAVSPGLSVVFFAATPRAAGLAPRIFGFKYITRSWIGNKILIYFFMHVAIHTNIGMLILEWFSVVIIL